MKFIDAGKNVRVKYVGPPRRTVKMRRSRYSGCRIVTEEYDVDPLDPGMSMGREAHGTIYEWRNDGKIFVQWDYPCSGGSAYSCWPAERAEPRGLYYSADQLEIVEDYQGQVLRENEEWARRDQEEYKQHMDALKRDEELEKLKGNM